MSKEQDQPRALTDFLRGNSQPPDLGSQSISPKKVHSTLFRGNSDQNDKSISPKKKGRGKNQIPASGSLVPVVQKKRDKLGRVVEYPKVEGVRVPRELAFDYPRQFNWQYCYSIQDEIGCWKTKKVNVVPEKVTDVRNAIAADRPISEVLSMIRGFSSGNLKGISP
jgi:hypothetical protein